MPVLGSNPVAALELARTLFKNAGITQGRILLVTDGVDQISEIAALAVPNFPISILGVGSSDGAAIPLDFVDQPGRFLTDRQGNTIVAKLDAARLATLAPMCYGRYATATADASAFTTLLATALPKRSRRAAPRTQIRSVGRLRYWLAMPLVRWRSCCSAAARRTVLCALLPPPAHASWWDDLWQRPDQQAMHALQNGEPEQAAALFKDPQWQGSRNRGEDYAGADRNLPQIHRRQAPQSRQCGPSKAGCQAIGAYEETLRAAPTTPTAFNKALLEKLLQQQQQQSGKRPESQRNRDDTNSEQSREQQSAKPSVARSQATRRCCAGADIKTTGVRGETKPQADDGKINKPRNATNSVTKTRCTRTMAARVPMILRVAAAQVPVRNESTISTGASRPTRPERIW
jgi:Ca-activated chloride channel family protein